MRKAMNVISWMVLLIIGLMASLGVSVHPDRQVLVFVLWIVASAWIGTYVLLPRRSRAEAEAMVEAYPKAIMEHGIRFTAETEAARDAARAALLAALCGEDK